MGPINYSAQLINPMGSIKEGMKVGEHMLDQQKQAAMAAQQEEANAAAQAEIASIMGKESPSAADFANLTVKYPHLNKQFEQAWGMMKTEQQQARISQASEVYAAIETGSPEIAQQLLEEQAAAAENSGDHRSAKAAKLMAQMVEMNPAAAKSSVGLRLAAMMGPDKFADTFSKMENSRRAQDLEGANLSATQSKAHKAAVDAKFAESKAAGDLQKQGWDIFKIQNDAAIAKENSKIAAATAQLGRTNNDLKREQMQLKIEEMQVKRDEAVKERAAKVDSARFNMDNMLNTLTRVSQTPMGVVKDATGPISSRLPTLDTDTANFEELVNTIDAQAFLAQIPNMTGLGALSDAEGKKLSAALQNFSLRQGAGRIMENTEEATRLLIKARKNLAAKYGVPDTVPDTPAADPGADEIDAILQKYQ